LKHSQKLKKNLTDVITAPLIFEMNDDAEKNALKEELNSLLMLCIRYLVIDNSVVD
jgi:hypothetical protein